MKKNILIPLFVLCIAQAFGQTGWPPIGAKWHYSYVPCDIWGGCSAKEFIYFEAVKDTLVNDTLCTKIIVEHHNGKKEVKYLGDEFIYSTENQVYSYHHGHFNLLYDFSVQVGDTVALQLGSNCNLYDQMESSELNLATPLPLNHIVVEKDSVEIDGKKYLFMDMDFIPNDIGFPFYLFFGNRVIIKGIGSLEFLTGKLTNPIESGFYGPLRCYSDSTVNYTTEIPCDYISELAAQEYQYVPFPDSGAVWSEVYNPSHDEGEPSQNIYERFALSGEDTLINNYRYAKLYFFTDSVFDIKNSKYIGGIREDGAKHIYYKGESIHWHKPLDFDNEELLLYDFSIGIGDTLWEEENTNIFGRSIVKDIDTIQIGNLLRKKFIFNFRDEWIEGIGSIRGLLFATLPEVTGTSSIANGSLICFLQNNEVLYHDEYYKDCFPSTVSIESKKLNHNITVYPNPANGNTVRFEWGDSGIENIEIFNLLGELVDSKIVTDKSFVDYPTNKMQPGIYVYKAIDKNGFYQIGRFVVE